MKPDRTPAALRLLRNQPGLTAWAVARRLNMDRAEARVMLLEAESAGLVRVTPGTICPEYGTQAKRYAPALPRLTVIQCRALSAVVLSPGLCVASLMQYTGCCRATAFRVAIRLERLGLIVTRVHVVPPDGKGNPPRRLRLCTPAPWVLA